MKSYAFKIKLDVNNPELFKKLGIDANKLEQNINHVIGGTGQLDKSFAELAETGLALNALKDMFHSLSSIVNNLASDFNEFDEGMRAVNTMAGLGTKELKGLKQEVEELANVIPLAKKELAEGLYQVISNGVPEKNWISFLKNSARSSVGGIAEVGKAVTVTSTIIKNYGLLWEEAGDIQDKIQTTAKNGVTSFEQLAEALPRVSGSASALGVSVDELMASFATLTGVSGNTAEVATQLKAIFTSLIKPSSEASKMAEDMGISFNAASIKASGGFEQFLVKLRESVTAYAESSGVLEQEVYGRLFGSAEAMNALIPLTGELASKYSSNVSAMIGSTGAIDKAFADMSTSSSAHAQMLKNSLSSALDSLTQAASKVQPYVEILGQLGEAAIGVHLLSTALTKLSIKTQVLAFHQKVQAFATRLVSKSSKGAAASIWAVNLATAALYATLTLGISVLITGIAMALNSVGDSANTAKDSIDDVNDSLEAFKKASISARSELLSEINSLKELIDSNNDATESIDKLNRKYGDAFGVHNTASEWYDTLIAKSAAYCKQKGYEAQAISLASSIAAKEMELQEKVAKRDAIKDKHKEMENSPERYTTVTTYQGMGGFRADEFDNLIPITTELNAANNEVEQIQSELTDLEKKFANITAKTTELNQELTGSADSVNKVTDVASMDMSSINKEIEELSGKITRLGTIDSKTLSSTQKRIKLLKEEKKRREDLIPSVGNNSKKSNNNESNKTVEVAPNINGIKTFEELNNAIQYYESAMLQAEEVNRATIQAQLNKLYELKQTWEDALHPEEAPGDISTLNTIEELNNALSYYEDKKNQATSSEIVGIQRVIQTLEKKKQSLQDIASLPGASSEANNLATLPKQELEIELQLIGLDGVQKRIRNLQKLLKDTSLDNSQRKEVSKLINSWKGYERQLKKSDYGMDKAYGSIRRIGSSVKNMTNLINSNANAWDMITGVIDNALEIYHGIEKVVSIIKFLTAATQAQTIAEEGKEVVTATATATKLAGDSAEAASSAAKLGVISSEVAAYQTLAASKAMAAHSSIPFVGIAIGVAAAATIAAVIANSAKSVPKFADGGIAYGPTLGIFGEYAGASSNPEVVAPLDKLKSLIGDNGGGESIGGKIQFKIKGRDLVGVLANETRISSRGGKASNIVL